MSQTPWEEYVHRSEEELFNELARGASTNTPRAARMWERQQSLRVADAVRLFQESTNASSLCIERLTKWMLVLTIAVAALTAVMAILTGIMLVRPWP